MAGSIICRGHEWQKFFLQHSLSDSVVIFIDTSPTGCQGTSYLLQGADICALHTQSAWLLIPELCLASSQQQHRMSSCNDPDDQSKLSEQWQLFVRLACNAYDVT